MIYAYDHVPFNYLAAPRITEEFSNCKTLLFVPAGAITTVALPYCLSIVSYHIISYIISYHIMRLLELVLRILYFLWNQ